jgi:hypothetical protein
MSNDLNLGPGAVGDFKCPEFLVVLGKVGRAYKVNGRILCIEGLYTRHDLMNMIMNELGTRWILRGNNQTLLCMLWKVTIQAERRSPASQKCGTISSPSKSSGIFISSSHMTEGPKQHMNHLPSHLEDRHIDIIHLKPLSAIRSHCPSPAK